MDENNKCKEIRLRRQDSDYDCPRDWDVNRDGFWISKWFKSEKAKRSKVKELDRVLKEINKKFPGKIKKGWK